jgi:hypothetical protein
MGMWRRRFSWLLGCKAFGKVDKNSEIGFSLRAFATEILMRKRLE